MNTTELLDKMGVKIVTRLDSSMTYKSDDGRAVVMKGRDLCILFLSRTYPCLGSLLKPVGYQRKKERYL